jgi:hypothetical protein
LKVEFGVKKNIKEEFCDHTNKKMQIFMRNLDKKFESIKQWLEERLQTKLLGEMEKFERFSNEFIAI